MAATTPSAIFTRRGIGGIGGIGKRRIDGRASLGSRTCMNGNKLWLPMVFSLRRPARLFVCLLGAAVVGTGLLATLAAQSPLAERDFLTRIRRLTVEGRRAGEGYWSKDGRRLVFQSEREPGNPFYQIYLMDMASGDVMRMSPGIGKTTCSFINPETGDVLFASTHHDPRSKQQQDEELKFRLSGQERRYSWDYDPEMELYVRSAKTGGYRRLTNRRGYDAEASYSPDGQ